MRIEQILNDPKSAFIHLERYVNNGSPSGFSRNTTSDGTSPTGVELSFDLPIIQFDSSVEVIDVGENSYIELLSRTLFCHPDNCALPFMQNIHNKWKKIDSVIVSPTASGRTVKCVKNYGFFVKLDYFGLIGRMTRNLDSKKVLSACEVSSSIKEAVVLGKMNPTFSFFQEQYGRYAKIELPNGDIYEMGFIIREDAPYPPNNSVAAYIPFFSLFSLDRLSPEDESLIVQLYKRQNESASIFCLTIIASVVNAYFDTLVNCGLCLEAHAQNMLIGLDKNGAFASVIARDMESVDKDIPLREHFGLKTQFSSEPYKCLHSTDYNYTIMHSFMFDFKLGCYLLDPLLDAMQIIRGFDRNLVTTEIINLVLRRSSDLPSSYFPSQWYNYENEKFERGVRRPYIAHEGPKYR